MSVGDACKAIRALRGLSQEEFAQSVGVSLNVIKGIESGKGNPNLRSLEKVAGAVGLKLGFIRPGPVVRLENFQHRIEEKRASRERDFDEVSRGLRSRESVAAANALKAGNFSYELPRLE